MSKRTARTRETARTKADRQIAATGRIDNETMRALLGLPNWRAVTMYALAGGPR